MKNWKMITAVMVLVVLNVVLMVKFLRDRSKVLPGPGTLKEAYSKENELISQDLAGRAALDDGGPMNLIGVLAERPFWTDVLKLSDEQKKSLKKLNDIVSEARRLSWLEDAKPYDGDPSVRRQRITANDKRREDAIAQAQRMVASGILNGQQAAFVTQRYLEAIGFNALYDNNNLEYLGELEPAQKQALEKVLKEFTEAGDAISSLGVLAGNPVQSPDSGPRAEAPKKELDFNKLRGDLWKKFNEDVRKTLTTTQLKKWDDLIAKRTPPEAPSPQERPATAKLETLSAEARKASPVFRALAESSRALRLSDDQERLLRGLGEIVGQCLNWIALDQKATPSKDSEGNQGDRTSQARSEFLKHAERYSTLGILREEQAKQLETLIKDK